MTTRTKYCALAVLGCWCVAGAALAQTNAVVGAKAMPGYLLFERNCAHCHGDDARGDEGPDLHGLLRGDTRLEKTIKNGIHGEMPAFGKKFSDQDVSDIIAWLRTLK